MTFAEFKDRLHKALTEEEVKATYAAYFNIEYDTSFYHDLYTPQVFFEFKVERNLHNLKSLATVLAQTLYYIRRLKYEEIQKPIPFFICLADKYEAALTEVRKWSKYYSSDEYDWQRPASRPDLTLIEHLLKAPEISQIHIYAITQKAEHEAFKQNLENALNPQSIINFGDKKVINEENFEAVFEHWKSVIGTYITNGYKPSFYFLSNIQREKVVIDRENNRVVFIMTDNKPKVQKVLMKDYDYFWSIYDYVQNREVISGIHAKLDRLTDESQRRFEGEFYTPLPFAKKAIHYLQDVLGKDWYKTGKYRIWDMAAGTGNLEYHLPAEAYPYLYLSTLHASEATHLQKVFPKATCFQYDYLNDDVDNLFHQNGLTFEPTWKMPKQLREELQNPNLTWIVYINPPFATAQDAKQKQSKTGVSKTKVEIAMDKANTGHAKRELLVQFMFRIRHEFPQRTYLAMFSKMYLNAPDSIEFRKTYLNCKFEKGFVFFSKNFHGVTGKYPISFLIWNLAQPCQDKVLAIDIADNQTQNIGIKYVRLIEKHEVLNNWFARPKNTKDYILPPLSNGITVKHKNVDVRHRARPDFLASICSNGNDFQHAKFIVILSSPNASAGAFTVIKENFEKALTLHAVRKIPKPTWLNDRNQFLIPHTEPSTEFLHDCVVWSLFAKSNETTALKNVKYQGKVYQINNHFFPFLVREIKQWDIKDEEILTQLSQAEDRFVAQWLATHTLSHEAQTVLARAQVVYQIFFAHVHKLITYKWKIDTWDAGWYQIRHCLAAQHLAVDEMKSLQIAHQALAQKILPQITQYGFLDKDEIF